ncbi:uncharacterized protein L201_007389 [Kwoniella dendrophila CBS 6074]|uniref:Uncharacterized protein n=1 Tax=Kwoniella dendrophila CBS 6074 TaxID=1295534 RepID=A0AAX4K3X2_9TREE
MTVRNSFISTSSSDTYPSTMSSLSHSALGLTDSPLRPRLRSSLVSATPTSSVPGTPVRTRPSQPQLRQAPSRNSLYQEATTNAARKVGQPTTPSEGIKTISPRSFQSNLQTSSSPINSRPTSRADTNTSSTSVPTRPATTPANAASGIPRSANISPARTTRPAQPVRSQTTQPPTQPKPVSTQRKPVPRSVAPSSPARTEVSLADQWEEELVQDTRQLSIRPVPTITAPPKKQGPTAKEKEEQRQRDMEWERSGMWETTRDPVREAEDMVRRDLGRDVAYPPATPRVPIRAAPTGVTSVHVGVRPRLHPTKAEDSMIRNQPDSSIPLPLFSPASASADLPGTAKSDTSNNNSRYDMKLAEKAKKEYEDWKARKAEREGGINDNDDNYTGTRQWVPKDREIARPGNVEGLAHSDAYEANHYNNGQYQMSIADQMILQQQFHAMQQHQKQQQPPAQAQKQKQAQKVVQTIPTVKVVKSTPQPKQAALPQTQQQTVKFDIPQQQDPVQPAEISYDQGQNWGYPYPYGMPYNGVHMNMGGMGGGMNHQMHGMGGMGQMQGMEGYYPEQGGYWDPSSYWYNMSMMGGDQSQMMTGQTAGTANDSGKGVEAIGITSESETSDRSSPNPVNSTSESLHNET